MCGEMEKVCGETRVLNESRAGPSGRDPVVPGAWMPGCLDACPSALLHTALSFLSVSRKQPATATMADSQVYRASTTAPVNIAVIKSASRPASPRH